MNKEEKETELITKITNAVRAGCDVMNENKDTEYFEENFMRVVVIFIIFVFIIFIFIFIIFVIVFFFRD